MTAPQPFDSEARGNAPASTRRRDHGVAFGGFGWRRGHDPVFGPSRNRRLAALGFEASAGFPQAAFGSFPEPNQRFEATAACLSVSIGWGDRTSASVPHPQR